MKRLSIVAMVVLSMSLVEFAAGTSKANIKRRQSREQYLIDARLDVADSGSSPSDGSLWRDRGPLSDLTSDNKATQVGDTVIVNIVEQTLAQANGTVNSERSTDVKSGITELFGNAGPRGVNPLLAANSQLKQKGQAQTTSSSNLRTSLAGRVISILPNGSLVIEAHRNVLMNNERQTITLRGVVRPDNILSNNVVLSTQLSELQVELQGKGVVSDGTRQPNRVMRLLLRLLTF